MAGICLPALASLGGAGYQCDAVKRRLEGGLARRRRGPDVRMGRWADEYNIITRESILLLARVLY